MMCKRSIIYLAYRTHTRSADGSPRLYHWRRRPYDCRLAVDRRQAFPTGWLPVTRDTAYDQGDVITISGTLLR